MDSLPQELVDRISSFLHFDDLKNTLVVSRSFQIGAEKYSGAFRRFTLTSENADEFITTYRGSRLQFLRKVEFKPAFPELKRDSRSLQNDVDDEDGDEDMEIRLRETKEDLDAKDQDFTRQINELFTTLKRLDSLGPNNIHLKIFTPTLKANPSDWGVQRNFVSWRVHLLSPDSLPSISCIRTLSIARPKPRPGWGTFPPSLRKLDSRVLLDLANKLPNLTTLRCKVGGDEWQCNYRCGMQDIYRYVTQDWKGPRRDSRQDFGKAIDVATIPNLRHAHLDFLYALHEVETIDQRWAVPDLTAPEPHDPFSSNLRLLSSHLRTMHIRVVADETLFWPASGEAPSWPLLENLHVVFHMSTPSGSWYFDGPPGTSHPTNIPDSHTTEEYPPLADTEQDEDFDDDIADMQLGFDILAYKFRVQPNNDTLVPFLAAFAKAASNMPALKTFAIWSPLAYSVSNEEDENESEADDDEDAEETQEVDLGRISGLLNDTCNDVALAWGIAYVRPHERPFATDPGEYGSATRQIWWRVGEWRPDNALHEQFTKIGRESYGEAVLEYYDGDGLAGRNEFIQHGQRCSGS